MAIQAVVFDYGNVLSGRPDAAAHAQMVRITGLSEEAFEKYYWADRHAYDEGKMTGPEVWRKLVSDAGLQDKLGEAEIEELNRWDCRMWTVHNPAMLAWQQGLKTHGIKSAVLSNIGDSVHDSIVREFGWLADFDAQIWSYQLGVAKPDAEIYRHALRLLKVEPQEALFLDDLQVNVEAARAVGMQSLRYFTLAQLSKDLCAAGLDRELPLPE